MPSPIDEKYIKEAEEKLNLIFPQFFKEKMKIDNGGEIHISEDDCWWLHPFWDKSNKKRLSRTCNDIVRETHSMKEWDNFPENAISIGSNGEGDCLVLIIEKDQSIKENIYSWNHETGNIKELAENINELDIN